MPGGVPDARGLGDPRPFRVAMVCLPFAASDRPSIQVGLLSAIARRAGFACDVLQLNVELAARLTPEVYEPLSHHRGPMTGEWLFSVAAFGEQACGPDADYFRAFPQELDWVKKGHRDVAFLSRLRHETLPAFMDDCMGLADWGGYDVVGLSSTFQQNVACLALARRIKEWYPHVKVIVGGANVDGEMGPEYLRAFPDLDYVVVGEGDVAFPRLLSLIRAGDEPEGLPGVAWRNGPDVRISGPADPVRDLDALPPPDYDDYFERMRRHGLLREPYHTGMVPFEGSRGCWWGQKHHCTFCGLNGLGLGFRSKSPDCIMSELTGLAHRYRITTFEATDNILDHRSLRPLFRRVAESKTDYRFFYEVKANLDRRRSGSSTSEGSARSSRASRASAAMSCG